MTIQTVAAGKQVISFAILMLAGYVAAKTNVVTKSTLNALTGLIVKIILPAFIFSIVVGSKVTKKEFLVGGKFAAGVVLCYSLLFLAGIVLNRVYKLDDRTKGISLALISFGNMGFFGIPLIQAIYNEPVAQVCISVSTIIDMTLLWTLGVYLCSRHRNAFSLPGVVKRMANPVTMALLLAYIITLSGISLPDLLMDTITGLGNSSKYLTLIYLGGTVACASTGNILKKPCILALAAVKMLLMPFVIYLISGMFLPEIPRTILAIVAGLPSMNTIAVMSAAFGSDAEYATETIFFTSLASLVTIPLISVLLLQA